MTFYITLSWWSGVGLHLVPDFLRLNLGFVQIGLCAWDIEEYIGSLWEQVDKHQTDKPHKGEAKDAAE